MDFIFVEGLRVEALIGIYPRERVAKQWLDINLTLGVPEAAGQHDDIADTIDYEKVVLRICAVLQSEQFNLLETLAEHLVGLMFAEFRAPWVRLSIAKPGVIENVRRVGVYIERARAGASLPAIGSMSMGMPNA